MAKTIFILLLLALFVQHFAECSSRGASSVEILHTQLFMEMKKKMALKKLVSDHSSSGDNELPEDWQLRRVPAGPDPLHHNGQDPKKPRTP
ncbi:protein CLAVATA 3 [Salvia miltiorrhiza]|uniref:protein CLAVATA 3 n=1 Tax=Salvia miltiorrhiza TaxID=226208 RepID=UPI0025ACCA76|nr:protein CLAVATA 3 [Salvia miltiorrhiza]